MYRDAQGRWHLAGDPSKGRLYTSVLDPIIDGPDLLVESARATWFGGDSDPEDNGETASGVLTKGHPELLGCALPMQGFPVTGGSPLPRLPWRTPVRVWCPRTNREVTVPLIELGPSPPPRANAGIDLTVAAFQALGGRLSEGVLPVRYRILGGTAHLPETVRHELARPVGNLALASAAAERIVQRRGSTTPGYCQRWVRQCVQAVYGGRYDAMWRASARTTALAWQAARRAGTLPPGVVVLDSPYDRDTRVGDLLYRLKPPFGHVSIRVLGNKAAENSTAHGAKALGFRPLAAVAFDVIVRLPEA